MRPGARVAAAIEIVADIEARRRPAADALKDWGLAHRFAGSGDRGALAGLVYDTLRHRASTAWRMLSEEPRALVLGMLVFHRGAGADSLAAMFDGDPHAPPPPTDLEISAFSSGTLDGAPPWVVGDFPEWLASSLGRIFGESAAEEASALAGRAPLDLRVNTLKCDRDKVLHALSRLNPVATSLSPVGIRIAPPDEGGRMPHVQSEAGFLKGWFEIQDEGSQLSALLAGVAPGMQVADICAGAGGKTLALATAMGGKGQIHAHDSDRRRLAPIYDRVQRAAARNVQIHAPAPDALAPLNARMDVVLVDAPCTGTGTWRRSPDAKWRVRAAALEDRLAEQRAALDAAEPLVKPGGRLVYVTCSVLPEENDDQIRGFLRRRHDFSALEGQAVWSQAFGAEPPSGIAAEHGLQLTPRRTATDGFYVAVMQRGA